MVANVLYSLGFAAAACPQCVPIPTRRMMISGLQLLSMFLPEVVE